MLEAEQYLADVHAAVSHALEASEQKARGVVLIGSSLGAALVAKVAWTEPKVTALALVSPGAAIDGVRRLPAVCRGSEPADFPRRGDRGHGHEGAAGRTVANGNERDHQEVH